MSEPRGDYRRRDWVVTTVLAEWRHRGERYQNVTVYWLNRGRAWQHMQDFLSRRPDSDVIPAGVANAERFTESEAARVVRNGRWAMSLGPTTVTKDEGTGLRAALGSDLPTIYPQGHPAEAWLGAAEGVVSALEVGRSMHVGDPPFAFAAYYNVEGANRDPA